MSFCAQSIIQHVCICVFCAYASGIDLSALLQHTTATCSFKNCHAETTWLSYNTKVLSVKDNVADHSSHFLAEKRTIFYFPSCSSPSQQLQLPCTFSILKPKMSSVFISCPDKGRLYFIQKHLQAAFYLI